MIKQVFEQDPYKWHSWFAWRPVKTKRVQIEAGKVYQIIWLEQIWRKTADGQDWEYSIKEPGRVQV